MANKLHSDRRPTIEQFLLNGVIADTGDLEAATKTITATSEGAVADYTSGAITLNAGNVFCTPPDTRLRILRIATRCSITIDSDDGTHDLRCRIYIDTQDADHLLYDLTFTTTGNQLASQCLTAATKAILFNLLNSSASHVYKFFFWTPGNHSPVISVANTWEAVGGTSSSGYGSDGWVMTFDSGPCIYQAFQGVRGSGTTTPQLGVYPYFNASIMFDPVRQCTNAADYGSYTPHLCLTTEVIHYRCKTTTTTGIAYPGQGMIEIMRWS